MSEAGFLAEGEEAAPPVRQSDRPSLAINLILPQPAGARRLYPSRQAIINAFGTQPTTKAMTGAGKREASNYAVKQLNERFADDGLVIDEVRIRAIYPDARSVETLRSRLAAQQNLRLASLNQQLQALENQKAVLKATAEAKAAQIRARSLTPRLVKFRHLKHLSIVGVPQGAIVNAAAPSLPVAAEPVAQTPGAPRPAPEPVTEEQPLPE